MKKNLCFLFVMLCLACPSSLFAFYPLTEYEMKLVFGQYGVSIEIIDATYIQKIGSITYTDDDGTNGIPGSVEIKDSRIVKIYKGLSSDEDFTEEFMAATISQNYPQGRSHLGSWDTGSYLTINTGTCHVMTACYNDDPFREPQGNIVGVVIGLPTLLVTTKEEEYTIGVSMKGAVNDNQNYFHVTVESSSMVILKGSIEIAAR